VHRIREFHLVDTAALHLGATPFSIYNTNSPEKINYPLAQAESRVAVCENQDVKPIRDTGYPIDHLGCVDGDIDGGLSMPQLEEASDPGFDFEATWKSVQPTDIVTLVYKGYGQVSWDSCTRSLAPPCLGQSCSATKPLIPVTAKSWPRPRESNLKAQ
jgi:hypothetical protein